MNSKLPHPKQEVLVFLVCMYCARSGTARCWDDETTCTASYYTRWDVIIPWDQKVAVDPVLVLLVEKAMTWVLLLRTRQQVVTLKRLLGHRWRQYLVVAQRVVRSLCSSRCRRFNQ
jgi:hypothetical protein